MKFLTIALSLLLSGCALIQREPASVAGQDEFNQAQKELDEGQFELALRRLQQFEGPLAHTPYTLSAIFLEGRALENLGRYSEAIIVYNRVMALTPQNNLNDEALLHLTYCFEASGDDVHLIASLLDLRKRRTKLPEATIEVELPARLASAYLRVGNVDEAKIHFVRAEKAFQKYQNRSRFEREKPRWAETLLAMGRASLGAISTDNLAQQEQAATEGSKFLIRALELNVAPHSQKAYDLLSKKLSAWVDAVQDREADPDDSFALRLRRQNQLALAKALSRLLFEANQYLLPYVSSESRPLEDGLRSDLQRFDQIVQTRLYEGIPENLLTPDSLRREGELHNMKEHGNDKRNHPRKDSQSL